MATRYLDYLCKRTCVSLRWILSIALQTNFEHLYNWASQVHMPLWVYFNVPYGWFRLTTQLKMLWIPDSDKLVKIYHSNDMSIHVIISHFVVLLPSNHCTVIIGNITYVKSDTLIVWAKNWVDHQLLTANGWHRD